jgi:hypothetical protein
MKIQTFIFVHDQEIILDYIKVGKFNNLENLKFVFLGDKDISKIENTDNVIISRNLPINMEQYPKFTSFTGWYSLWKNNLIDCDYINLFEYDVNIVSHFQDIQFETLKNKDLDFVGYIPYPVNSYEYVKNINWVKDIIPSIQKIYNIDVYKLTDDILDKNINSVWSSTSNSTFKKEAFFEYMEWFERIIEFIKNSNGCGHAHERSISFFYFIHNKKVKIIPRVMSHFQLDSHKTQGHEVNFNDAMNKLLKN